MFKRTALSIAISLLAATGALASDWGCTTAGVNYRSGPATSYDKLGTIPAYTRLEVDHCSSEYGANWCKVSWNGYSGWISSRYLSYELSYCEAHYNQPPRYEQHSGGSNHSSY
jgi:uncharacterized protein YraI